MLAGGVAVPFFLLKKCVLEFLDKRSLAPKNKSKSDELPLIHYLCIMLVFAIRLSFVGFQDTKILFLSKGGPTITNLIMDVFRVFCYRLCF